MDTQIASLIRDAETSIKPMQKWRVKWNTESRNLTLNASETYPEGKTFFGNWVVKMLVKKQWADWVKDYDHPRWVRVSDCEYAPSVEPPPQDDGDSSLMWLKSDFQLRGTSLERSRPNISGQPQTAHMACTRFGLVPASDAYIELTLGLNPGMTVKGLEGMMDSWTPKGAKWLNGERKVPCEITFASNPIPVIGSLRNPGGLTGIKGGEKVWQIDTLPYDALENYTSDTIPSRYVVHLTLSVNGTNIVNPSPAMGGRTGKPVKLLLTSKSTMYVRYGLMESLAGHTNRYEPPWDKGIIG
jgi:hypothetical protein